MTLPQNVKDAVESLECEIADPEDCTAWQTIRAHLMSQDAEIERLQSGLAAADAMLEATERTLERCKQTLDTTSECWRLDAERLEAAERDSKRLDWLESQREAYGFENCHEGNRWVIDGPFATVRRAIDAAQEGEG